MQMISFTTALKNIKKRSYLLLSTLSTLCLFSSPSLISFVLMFCIFAIVVAVVVFDLKKPIDNSARNSQIASFLITVLVVSMGFYTFNTTWVSVGKVAVFAKVLGLSINRLVLVIGVTGCIVAFYAIYVFSCWLVSWSVKRMRETLPVQQKIEIIANLKRNFYFPISATAFFFLNITLTFGCIIGLFIALLIALLISSQISSVWKKIRDFRVSLHILSIVTAGGICLASKESFYIYWSEFLTKENIYFFGVDVLQVIGVVCAVIAIFFTYFWILLFWDRIIEILRELEVFNEIKTIEWIIYIFLVTVSLGFMMVSFVKSQAFYGIDLPYDVIYTSDSSALMKGNVYLALMHPENDLRQPLFAIFATPFVAIPYLIAKLMGASVWLTAVLINSGQIIILFFANFMLAKMLGLDSLKRICFILLVYCTYTPLLFTLMMEQYIVAYFWLVFCIYLVVEKQQPDRIVVWGASGTLLTSIVFLFCMTRKSLIKDLRGWFWDVVVYGFEFVLFLLMFCRFDIILNLMSRITFFANFTGRSVGFLDKIYQYTEFVVNCFVAPNAGVRIFENEHISWQLNISTGVNFVGVIILCMSVISAIWNHNKKSSLLAIKWIGVSVAVLLGLGWGTNENGLILYSLYFGWAFLVLLFQLVEKVEKKLNVKFLLPITTICTASALLVVNIPAIIEMLNFAITYYPV